MLDLKKEFPIFAERPGLVYLDSAATTQKPQCVIDEISDFLSKNYASVDRGSYDLAAEAEQKLVAAKKKIANFVGADWRELVFSHNASYCLNLLAQSLCLSGVVTKDSCVVLGSREHHANLVPWLQLQKVFGFSIEFLEIDENFSVDFDRVRQISSEKNVAVLSLAWVSNVSGTIFPVEEIRAEFGENVFTILDASQAVVHFSLEFSQKNFDAMFFSAHKIYAMTGVGALLLKKSWISQLEPLVSGGGVIESVARECAVFQSGAGKFEPGTGNLVGILSLARAVERMENLGRDAMHEHLVELGENFSQKISAFPAKILGGENPRVDCVFSLVNENRNLQDVNDVLADAEICVRIGGHCAYPLFATIGTPGSLRVSLGLVNDFRDLEKFFAVFPKVFEK